MSEGVIVTYVNKIVNGGIERVVSLLLPIWTKLGYKVILLTDEETTNLDYPWDIDGVTRIVIQNRFDEKSKNKIKKRQEEFRGYIREYKITHMVYHMWCSPAMKCDQAVFKEAGIPFIIYTHNHYSVLLTAHPLQRKLLLEEYKKAELVLSLNVDGEDFFKKTGIRSRFVNNPINPQLLLQNVSKLNNNRLLWLGRLSIEKRPQELLEIFRQVILKRPEIILCIVGENNTDEGRKTIELVKQYGLQNNVEFVGYTNEIEKYYSASDIFIMTSEFEGSPNTIIESKAFGLPIVMYDLPYINWCKDPKGLIICKQQDISLMANEIINLLEDRKYLENMGVESRKSLEEAAEFDLSKYWKDIFDNVNSIEREDIEIDDSTRLINGIIEADSRYSENDRYNYQHVMEYRIGKAILAIPRMIQRIIKNRKNR